MEIKFVKYAEDPRLVDQYIAMRAKATSKDGKEGLPDQRIKGDDNAVFILAVEDGKVDAGIRLTSPDPERGGWVPADKVEGARLEAMFPDRDDLVTRMRHNEDGYKVFYVDGIFADTERMFGGIRALGTVKSLLQSIHRYAMEHGGGMVYCFPYTDNGKTATRIFDRQGVPSVNLGPQAYIGRDGSARGSDRNLLAFFLNHELEQAIHRNGHASSSPVNGHRVQAPRPDWRSEMNRPQGGPPEAAL